MEIKIVDLSKDNINLEELISFIKSSLKEKDSNKEIESIFEQAEIRFGKNWKVREIKTNFGKLSENRDKDVFFDKENDILVNNHKDILYAKGKWATEITFKPFEKVVVFDEEENIWFADIMSHYNPETGRFYTIGYNNVPFENISKDLSLIGKSR
jgi:hypothetical protein